MARSLRRCISGPYGSGQLHDDSSSSLQGTYNNCCLSRPFHCRLLSSGQQHWKHRLSSTLILVGLLFCSSCIAHLFSDYNKQITRSHAIHIIGSYGEHVTLKMLSFGRCPLLPWSMAVPLWEVVVWRLLVIQTLAFLREASRTVPGLKPNLSINKIILYTCRTRRNRKCLSTNADVFKFCLGVVEVIGVLSSFFSWLSSRRQKAKQVHWTGPVLNSQQFWGRVVFGFVFVFSF